MGVGPNDQHTGLRPLAAELGVHDGVVHALVLGQLEDAPRALARLDQRLDLRHVEDARVHHVVPGDPQPVVAEDARLPERVVRLFHAVPRQLGRDHPVDVEADHVPGSNLTSAGDIVRRKDLFGEGHPATTGRSMRESRRGGRVAVLVVQRLEIRRDEEEDFRDFLLAAGQAVGETQSSKIRRGGAMLVDFQQRISLAALLLLLQVPGHILNIGQDVPRWSIT